MLIARVRGLPFERALALDGEDDSGGMMALGGGGKVVFPLAGLARSYGGDSTAGLIASSGNGEGLRSRSGFLREVISAERV